MKGTTSTNSTMMKDHLVPSIYLPPKKRRKWYRKLRLNFNFIVRFKMLSRKILTANVGFKYLLK